MTARQLRYRVLTGPTAAGKTQMLLRRAERVPLVLISADSRQVYRYMDIGTGKSSPAEREKVTQFGLDLANPSEKLSVFSYLYYTSDTLKQLEDQSVEIWICGGTGLYLRALLDGLALGASPQPELRPLIEAVLQRGGPASVAQSLGLEVRDPHNPRRVLRAIEDLCVEDSMRTKLSALLGCPLEQLEKAAAKAVEQRAAALELQSSLKRWHCAGLAVLDPGKEELESMIEARVQGMFKQGLIDECSRLRDLGFANEDVVKDGIGYREGFAVLAGELDLAAAVQRTIVRTRQYAKRQRTFFRGQGWPTYTAQELHLGLLKPA